MTDSVTILSIGSPFGADSIGYEISRWLKGDKFADNYPEMSLEIDYLDRPGMRLLEYLRGRSKVILIDAMRAGFEAGSVKRLEIDELQRAGSLSSHAIGVADALALAEALGESPKELIVLGVEIGETDRLEMDELCQAMKQALQEELQK